MLDRDEAFGTVMAQLATEFPDDQIETRQAVGSDYVEITTPVGVFGVDLREYEQLITTDDAAALVHHGIEGLRQFNGTANGD